MAGQNLGAVPDPRAFRPAADAPPIAQGWYALAEEALGAETGRLADRAAATLRAAFRQALAGQVAALDDAINAAPSPAVARVLWRELDAAWLGMGASAGLDATVFAIPLVIVAAMERAGAQAVVPGVLDGVGNITCVLREGRVLGANENFALANTLVGAGALAVTMLPRWLAVRRGGIGDPEVADLLAPAALRVSGTTEGVHLRFLCGRAIHAPGVDLLHGASVGAWGMALARRLHRELGAPGLSLLALPRPPGPPLPALHRGLAAQREVGAQLFASNAIRKLRAGVGEPQAVISAHVAPDAPAGGELRLSLSSPFEPRDAEGFRCPVFAIERVADVAAMLVDLMHDCRVTDVRVVAGVHPDRLPGSAMPLLFKPDTVPGDEAGLLQ